MTTDPRTGLKLTTLWILRDVKPSVHVRANNEMGWRIEHDRESLRDETNDASYELGVEAQDAVEAGWRPKSWSATDEKASGLTSDRKRLRAKPSRWTSRPDVKAAQRHGLHSGFWAAIKDNKWFGTLGEDLIHLWLNHHGYGVMRVAAYDDRSCGAPMILQPGNEATIMPDLQAGKDRRSHFVECKAKRRWTHEAEHGTETGCEQRNYRDYCKAYKVVGKLWMAFVHVETKPLGLYFGELHGPDLRAWDGLHKVTREKMRPPMMLWKYRDLRRVATLAELLDPSQQRPIAASWDTLPVVGL